MIINCPVCGGQLTITPQHFGHNVNCPHCTRVFQVPVPSAQPVPAVPPQPMPPGMPASPVPPHLLQATTAQPQPSGSPSGHSQAEAEQSEALARYHEKRGKSTTATVIWVIVLAVGVPALIGGIFLLYVLTQSSKEATEERRMANETRKTAIRQAQNNLGVRGFKNLAKVDVSGEDSAPVVTGEAEKDGDVHAFACKFRITETADRIAWSVEYIEIDGQIVYSHP